jgi:hypothetical protein
MLKRLILPDLGDAKLALLTPARVRQWHSGLGADAQRHQPGVGGQAGPRAGAGRADMVAKALSGDFGRFDCPAGMVEGIEQTLWFTTQDALEKFDAMAEDEEMEE